MPVVMQNHKESLSLLLWVSLHSIIVNQYIIIIRFKRQPHKMVKHTQTVRQQHPTNCLSVFDRSVGLAVKGLSYQ